MIFYEVIDCVLCPFEFQIRIQARRVVVCAKHTEYVTAGLGDSHDLRAVCRMSDVTDSPGQFCRRFRCRALDIDTATFFKGEILVNIFLLLPEDLEITLSRPTLSFRSFPDYDRLLIRRFLERSKVRKIILLCPENPMPQGEEVFWRFVRQVEIVR